MVQAQWDMLSVETVMQRGDASREICAEDVQISETSERSERKYKLLCNPSNLPKPPLPATKETNEAGKPKYILNIIKDYFYHAKMRSIKRGDRR